MNDRAVSGAPRPELEAPSRLARRLGTFDAVVIGLGAMIGAGVFSAFGPAADIAGNGLLIGLAIAALVAFCNATSSAQLAAIYPESGGAYVYGRKRLGAIWGFVAGWGFVIGKIASCAAMAATFASHVAPTPALVRPLAAGAALVVTAVNYFGVRRTAVVTRVLVAVVLTSLAIVLGAVWTGGAADVQRLWPIRAPGAYQVVQSAGLLFFAFAGYARIATLGEEVARPGTTIPRAIPIALGFTLVVYAAVAVSAIAGAGTATLASSTVPLATAVESGQGAWLSPAVRVGAAVASLGVLLSLTAGVSRTIFAMASQAELPKWFAAVHSRHRVPHRAELTVGALVALVSASVDLRSAIGFSSFAVLGYYAIANAAAWTLPKEDRRWPRAIAAAGLFGCVALAITLPPSATLGGSALLALGALGYVLRNGRNALDKRA